MKEPIVENIALGCFVIIAIAVILAPIIFYGGLFYIALHFLLKLW